MSNSTRALMLKPDGTPVETTFFTDNAEAIAAVAGGGGGGGAVASVNGHVGVVVLTASDVGAPTASAMTTALNGKAAATRNIGTANSLQGGGDLTGNRTLQLVGDVNAPGPRQFYGTDASGNRNWLPFPDRVYCGVGTLQGYTDAGSDDVPATPASFTTQLNSPVDGDTFTITFDGVPTVFEFDINGDGLNDGSHVTVPSGDITAVLSAVSTQYAGAITAIDQGGGLMQVRSTDPGAGHTLDFGWTGDAFSSFGGIVPGTDDIPAVAPSGEVTSVELLPAIPGKALIPIALLTQLGEHGGLNGVSVLISRGGATLATLSLADGSPALDLLSSGMLLTDIFAEAASQNLSISMSGTTPVGGSATVMVACISR